MFYLFFIGAFALIGFIIWYRSDGYEGFPGAIIGGIIGGCLSIFIFVWAAKNAETIQIAEEKTPITACVVQQVQTSKSSSTAHIVWVNDKGETIETPCYEATIVDSTDYCYVVKKYETKGWFMKLLYSKSDEIFFYAPYDEMFHSDIVIEE